MFLSVYDLFKFKLPDAIIRPVENNNDNRTNEVEYMSENIKI